MLNALLALLVAMIKHLKRVALVAVSSAAFSAEARAETFNFDYYCITGAFQVCASVRLEAVGNVLRMRAWNLDAELGGRHTITAIGLYHAGTDYDWSGKIQSYTVTYNGTDITDYWTKKGSNDIGNLAGTRLEIREGTAGNAGIIGCNDPGGDVKWATCNSFSGAPYVEFTFNLSEPFSLQNVQLRWHSQQVGSNAELSLKCDTGNSGDYPPCMPTQVVPEPATIVLMGTGLVAAAGAARRRRRNKDPVIS